MFDPTTRRAVFLAVLVLIPIRAAALSRLREAPRRYPSVAVSDQLGAAVQTELKLGVLLQGRIKGGETHSFTVSFTSGQYAAIDAEEHGCILLVTLRDPSGKDVVEMDTPSGGYGPIYLSHIAAVSGNYRLEIRSVNSWAIEAPYDVSLTTLRTSEPADETVVTGQSRFSEGRKSAQANDQDSAIAFYEQSLTYWNKFSDSHWQALTQYALSGAYVNRSHEGDNARSEKCLQATLQILKTAMAANDWRLMASALNDLGVLNRRAGNPSQAEEEFDQALTLYASHQDRRGQASVLGNRAARYRDSGDLSVAREILEQALALRRAENDRPGELNLLNNVASLYDKLGEPDKALPLLTEVLNRWRDIPLKDLRPADHEKMSSVLNNLAAVSDKLGDWNRAKNYYDEALAELGAGNVKSAATLDNLGEHFAALNDPKTAVYYYNQALTLLPPSSKPNSDIKAGILVHLGQILIAAGDVTSALDDFDQALALNSSPPKQADVLTNQGAAFVQQGDVEKGLAAYEEAWKIQSGPKTEDRRAQALILQKRGEALELIGKPTEAMADLTRALDLWKGVKNQPDEATTHNDIARIESRRGNLETALTENEQAIAIIESLRGNTSNPQLRTSYFAKHEDYYEMNVELKMQLGLINKRSDYVNLALESNEKARARVLLEALAVAGLRTDCEGSVDRNPATLISAWCSMQNRLTAKVNARTQLLNGRHSPQQVALLDNEIDGIVEKYEAIEAQIKSQNVLFASLAKPQPLTSKQIQEQLDNTTLLIEYSLQDRHSYVWAVTPDSVNAFELPGRAEIEAAAGRFTTALTAHNREVKGETQSERNDRRAKADIDSTDAAAALSKMILQPLASWLGQKRLVIVADGVLQVIPFVALPAPANSGPIVNEDEDKTLNASRVNPASIISRLLVDDHEIITLPSASVLGMQRRALAGRKPAPHAVAILANPVFEATDPRVKDARRTGRQSIRTTKPKGQTPHLSQGGSDAGSKPDTRGSDDKEANEFHWLPHSLEEAQAIMRLAPVGEAMQALDFKASRATAMSPELSQYRVVHFATHGIADLEHPEESRVILSMVNENGQRQNGYLRLRDIYNLNLPAELVVLSACETGVGKQIKGEGLIALTRGFMYAGAARVVASLWKVDDAATAELMTQFYKEMFLNRLTPAAALRAAQISISKKPRWHSPYFWAGFILQGEWR